MINNLLDMLRFKVNASHLLLRFDSENNLSSLNFVSEKCANNEDGGRRRRSMVLASPTPRSPLANITTAPASAPASAPESPSSRPGSGRTYKRITPPRDSPRHRPRSSTSLIESNVVPSDAPVLVNGGSSPPVVSDIPADPLPDVVVISAAKPSSILKKKSIDETTNQSVLASSSKPVSILKRKTSQEEGVPAVSQPVTFSPSVLEPTTSRRQGILKKHRSLDDGSGSTVLLRRSSSPDKPILRHQRRSSLEEVRRRTQSPEPQGILKRKTSRDEAIESCSTMEPQGILKRKTSAPAGPVHVTIADSVILAVAGEDSVTEDHVRPILKKKTSLSEEPSQDSPSLTLASEPPKPILKKKSSSETEESEDKPKKPILKSRSSSRVSEGRNSFTDLETPMTNGIASGVDVEPSVLSVRSESSPERSGVIRRIMRNEPDTSVKRRSLDSWVRFKEDCERRSTQSTRVRASWSVAERVLNMESFLASEAARPRSLSPSAESKGAVPKRTRIGERWRTQPITVQELSNSKSWSREEGEMLNSEKVVDNSEDVSEEPMPRLARSNSVSARASMFEAQLRQQQEEAEVKKVTKGSAARRVKLDPSRFQTQPVTQDEVEEAKRANEASKATTVSGILKNLSEKNLGPKPKVKPSSESEDESAKEPASPQKRGILKSPSRNPESAEDSETSCLKSVLKKENKITESDRRSKDLHSILKVSKDHECSSSEETETDSEDDKPNANSDLIDLLHKVEAQARGERKANVSPEIKKIQTTPNNKKPEESDKLMNLKNLDQGKENYDVTKRFRRKKESGDLSGEDSSSSGGREVKKIISNEAVARRRQAGLAREAAERVKRSEGLSKSRSHSAMNGEVVLRPPSGVEPSPLRRCKTQPMDECDEPLTNGVSIAQRLEALQKRGQTDWKKRVSRLNPEEELPPTININAAAQVLAERVTSSPRTVTSPPPTAPSLPQTLSLLEEASQGWKKRVSPSDATQFSVAGKMGLSTKQAVPASPLLSPNTERKKVKPERFRSKGLATKDVQSMPTSPEAEPSVSPTPAAFKRSVSAPGDDDNYLSSGENEGPLVTVPKAFDEDFTNFFASSATNERIELRVEDLETVTSSTSQLLAQRKQVRIQKRRVASSNPIKALAARTDLRDTYVEVKSGIASREEQRLRIEKLAKNSSLAVEALAGLASKEDFAAVQLRSAADTAALQSGAPWVPYKELMLLQVKGRRHVQTRLVRPHYSSVNQGDSYVLVTPSQVFQWIGEFSNVIERSRSAEIASHIAQTRDLGCAAGNYTVVQGKHPNNEFWQLLGADEHTAANYTGAEAGHPDEDELYELAVTDTNKIYELEGDELVPREDCWASIPKIEILHHNKVLVFDFGAELYVWMGKSVSLDRRPTVLKLAQEMWNLGFNYSECDICPITQAELLGTRTRQGNIEKKAASRPDWCLLAKVTQHMETVLFREKFLDWPDFSRVIQVKNRDKDKNVESAAELKPCDAKEMFEWKFPEPDLELEGSHLGRGHRFYDSETHRHFEISTLGVTVWHVQEFDSTELDSASIGQFHSGDSYVVRWHYSVTVTGRELTGKPSRHSTMGRDRVAYWTWQGQDATINDSGAAALLTVQLDEERGPQLTIKQGNEPPAFRRLFNGGFVIHKGRRCDTDKRDDRWRLYIVLGEEVEEALLLEVPLHCRQLRSRGCLVLLDTEEGVVYLWRGSHALDHTYKVALSSIDKLKERLPNEASLDEFEELQIEEVSEGKEPKMFFEAVGGHNRQMYLSLLNSTSSATHTPKLYLLTGVSGVLTASGVTPACHHSTLPSPFPYSQQLLYESRQPALYLLDCGTSLWLWQGWVPEDQADAEVGVRWQAERRAAMATALEYHRLVSAGDSKSTECTPPMLVWAGLEPLAFTNVFPTWEPRDDIAEINIRDGHGGEAIPVEEELERLMQRTFPPTQLLQRPLPDGVDPTKLEDYLAPHHFQEVLGLTKEEFSELPAWKQNKLKQEKGLF